MVMGLLDEKDNKISLTSLAILLAIAGGLILMAVAVWKPSRAFIVAPASGVIIAALGGTAIKANKGSS